MTSSKQMLGEPVSPGVAIGKAYLYNPATVAVKEDFFSQGKESFYLAKFQRDLEATKEELKLLQSSDIFLAHSQILEDEELLTKIRWQIENNRCVPEWAVHNVFEEYIMKLQQAKTPLIIERAKDLEDVKQRLVRICQRKEPSQKFPGAENHIVVAKELFPSDIVVLKKLGVRGIITELGEEYSHAVILARSFQIPMLIKVDGALEKVTIDEMVTLDAERGFAIAEPIAEEGCFQDGTHQENVMMCQKEGCEGENYRLEDGTTVELGININSAEFETLEQSYDFVGLVRTEFLYMEYEDFPTEEEQFRMYRDVLKRASGKTVILRTLDIGEDKMLPYISGPCGGNEKTLRGLEFCFANSDVFLTQLRAMLRASAYGSLQIMFPMVKDLEDICKAKDFVEQAKVQLEREGYIFDKQVKFGIMIEKSTLFPIMKQVVEAVDFASIGTNDLLRGQQEVDLNQLFGQIRDVAEIFKAQGKSLSVCGELAGNSELTEEFLKVGIRRLSMDSSNIGAVKKVLSALVYNFI